jgi:predicted secreted protein
MLNLTSVTRLLSFLFASVLASSAALGQNQFSLGTLQPGQLLLNLSATEQREVAQDTLNATLQFSVQGRDQTELQNDVNMAMRKAVDLLEADGRVDFSTTQYHVYIIEPGRPSRTDIENPVWRAQQGVALTSMDSAALLDLAGQLQASGLVITNQYYSLSSARYEEIAGQLLQAALGKLQQRADATATGLGKSSAELVEVSLDGSPNFAYRERGAFTSMAIDAAMAPPVAAPGETQVSLTVTARAILQP